MVEDEYLPAQGFRYELEDMGAVVLGPVPSMSDTLALLEREARPDAAILDIDLGGEMVFPLAEALRNQSVPSMFATGYDPWSLPPGLCRGPPLREALRRRTLPAHAVWVGPRAS